MIPASFDYVAPASVEEALTALVEAGEDGKVLAGGQSLLPVLRLRMAAPGLLVDLRKIDELHGVRRRRRPGGDRCDDHPPRRGGRPGRRRSTSRCWPKTEGTVADPAVRHRRHPRRRVGARRPRGGSRCGGAWPWRRPSRSPEPAGGARWQPADFFQDYFATAVGEDEILVSVSFPSYGRAGERTTRKFTRVAQSWSIVSVAAAIKLSGSGGAGGTVEAARVGLTNMGPVPIRAHAVEQALVGRSRHRCSDQGGRGGRRGRDLPDR